MPQPFDTFEPSEKMRPVYEGLLAAFTPWGVLRSQPILSDPRIQLGAPASVESLMKVHDYLRSPPPPALALFWEITDGLRFDFDTIVFSTAQFVDQNRQIRTLPHRMPFEGLCFIGSMGDGDMFAMGRTTEGEWLNSVMIWEHETDRRYEVAESLAEYVAKMIVWWADESHG